MKMEQQMAGAMEQKADITSDKQIKQIRRNCGGGDSDKKTKQSPCILHHNMRLHAPQSQG